MFKYVGEEISKSNPTLLAESALQFKYCICVCESMLVAVIMIVIVLIKEGTDDGDLKRARVGRKYSQDMFLNLLQ